MALKKPGDIFKHPQAQPVFTNLSNIEEQLSKAEVLLPKEKVDELRQQLESVSNSIDTSLSEVSDGSVDYSVVRKELDRFNTKITHIEEDLNEKVDDLRQKHTDIKTGIQIVQTRQNNIHPEKLKEEVIHRVKNILIGNIGENIRELEERVDVIKGSYKQTLSEGLLNEPPTVNNTDPLTPLNKKFVTLDEFQSHYKLFINRIQTQLATLGGGGAVNIRELDDVDHATARVNGKYLKYNSTTTKWEGADASGGGGSALTIQDEGTSLATAATALNFVGAGVSASGIGTTKTITISTGGGGGSQNLFQTIAVSGQDNVVADSTTDTLTFVGGVGIAITTNAASDTVSFASTFTKLTTEEVQDIVGGMFSGNTETNITATYQDADGTIDLDASAGALSTRTWSGPRSRNPPVPAGTQRAGGRVEPCVDRPHRWPAPGAGDWEPRSHDRRPDWHTGGASGLCGSRVTAESVSGDSCRPPADLPVPGQLPRSAARFPAKVRHRRRARWSGRGPA